MQLLAILGRGIRQREDLLWIPTEDLEIYGANYASLVKQQPADDANPNCLVGGGTLNILAGEILCRRHRKTLKTVVCAYGGRSRYLTEIGGPSEGQVMSDTLRELMPNEATRPEIVVWPKEQQAESGKTNTYQELINVFSLAKERDHTNVGITTVLVHYARTLLMASRLLQDPRFVNLEIQCFISEDVIVRVHPGLGESIRKMHGSKAFTRSLFFEQRGINCLLAGNY